MGFWERMLGGHHGSQGQGPGVGMAADTVTAAAMVMGTAALSIQVGGAVLRR